jgi:GTP cyclohydrolase FolE2
MTARSETINRATLEIAMNILELPTYRRRCDDFQTIFGLPPQGVLTAMSATGDDIPTQRPKVPIAIDAVGMRRPHVLIGIRDPFGSGVEVRAICTVTLRARVPETHRGLHISRIGAVLADSTAESYRDVHEYARKVASAVAEREYGAADVLVRASVPYVEDVSSEGAARPKRSLEHLRVIARCRIEAGAVTMDAGLHVTHIVACPCVQQTAIHTLRASGQASSSRESFGAGPIDLPDLPFMTHSQRCTMAVMIRHLRAPFSPHAMLSALDDVLVRTCNTLPRDAELACVYRAHRSPQFIEDALRDGVEAVARLWRPELPFSRIDARARSAESIHDFDLHASTTLTAARARTLAGGAVPHDEPADTL